jgi:hypothetical protein
MAAMLQSWRHPEAASAVGPAQALQLTAAAAAVVVTVPQQLQRGRAAAPPVSRHALSAPLLKLHKAIAAAATLARALTTASQQSQQLYRLNYSSLHAPVVFLNMQHRHLQQQ